MIASLASAATMAALACGAWAVAVEPLCLEVRRLRIPIPDLPPALHGLRLGLLADLHAGSWAQVGLYRRAARILARHQVDALLLAGDVTSHHASPHWREVLAPLAEVAAPLGRLAVLGGHDHRFGASAVAGRLGELGFRVLRNEAIPLRRQGQDLWVVGLDDNSSEPRMDDFERACGPLPPGAPTVVVAHSPDAVRQARRRGLGLVLSGHTHGGQVRLPWVGSLVRVTHLSGRFDQGLSRHGSTHLYVSRGLSSTHRLRFLCRPDVSILTLVRAG